ncbi:DUF1552 domain-containing protein [Flavilitoribacter nigricans]|uniref:DUF1552 domain-containing protein n=1 Tax=Flavilitoribacter nigricans (strain ATCC 23147 / DSM 23189 / NBRC 102662 / NCIMB 1420 / SS-2) TaxID=1122177 RepID=A0A2D0N4W3_FLAN2|nr:DUF1552 domain-containing protein [Flavilitoribacter nigricans]PHN03416.1 hypothetical protein CRP01_27420 [Flavilitoribacter nigricans DSM 23189 = NBRC 102662]
MKRKAISRRKMLQGLGACVALPFLEAMTPPGVSTARYVERIRPKRLAVFYFPNGVHSEHWTPKGRGNDFELSRTLKPLEPFKKDLLVLSELKNREVDVRGTDGHYAKTAPFLTCHNITKTTGSNIDVKGVSMDQVAARQLGGATMFPSLEYGVDPIISGVDQNVGYTRLYGSAISWASPNQPCSKEIDPHHAFNRLFRTVVPGASSGGQDPWRKSVLDLVMDDAKRLNKHLGAADQNKMSEYLESVRSVEKRLTSQDKLREFEANITPDIRKELVKLNVRLKDYVEVNSGYDVTQKVRLMMDINALALWSDATRVTTFMFGNSVSNRNFSFLDGVTGNHHTISHHRSNDRLLDMYSKINYWHTEQYAYFLEKMRSMKEGDQSLLDQSMVLYGSSLRDGNSHQATNLPIVVAGKGGGALKTGQNLAFEKETPLANLYLAMLKALDVKVDQFGDSERVLTEILA